MRNCLTGKNVKAYTTSSCCLEHQVSHWKRTRILNHSSWTGIDPLLEISCIWSPNIHFGDGKNQVHELTRHFANPGEVHWKDLDHFVGYSKANKEDIKLTYRYRKPRLLHPVSIVDSNYATDKTDRPLLQFGLYNNQ